jgi:mercuric ion binding protein
MKKAFYSLLTLGFILSINLSAQAQCCKPTDKAVATASSGNSVTRGVKQEKMETVKLKISGMTCAGCASHVHKVLSETPGVVGNAVEYPGDIAVIRYNPDKTKPELIIEAIEKSTPYKAKLIKEETQKKS